MPKYGPYDAPYWHRRWEREEAESKKRKVGTLDFDQIVNAAYDYMDSYAGYRRMAIDRRKTRDEVERAYRHYEKYEAVFWAVCMATGIPQDAAIAASRIGDRYYNDHGGTLCVDNEKLIRSLI